jgi:hypothetical protein
MKVDLRKEAKGRPCMVMLDVCNRNSETTVLAHLNNKRLFRCGMGMKVPDIFGAWACSSCHDVLDGRQKGHYTEDKLYIEHMEGVFRTQNILLNENKIKIGE